MSNAGALKTKTNKRPNTHVNRHKNGIPSVHPLRGPEIRALHRLKRDDGPGAYVFMTEPGGPMTTDNVRKLLQRRG